MVEPHTRHGIDAGAAGCHDHGLGAPLQSVHHESADMSGTAQDHDAHESVSRPGSCLDPFVRSDRMPAGDVTDQAVFKAREEMDRSTSRATSARSGVNPNVSVMVR